METFDQLLQKTGEYGVVYQVSHPIVFIEGLPNAKTHEVIMFDNGEKAEVFSINRGKIEARVFAHEPIRVGTKVARTDQLLSLAVGKELLGHMINPLGEPLDPSDTYTKPTEMRDLDARPVGISGRQKITKRMATGIALVDLMLPLGIGQRELIIGDRKTGKTSVILTAIKKQAYEGIIVIYAAIAKKKSEIKKLKEFFVSEKIMDNIVIVASSSYDSPTMIYQTPYAAMAIAEHFRDLGQNTLVVLDDLSTHAKFYRELSLLAKRFPGRDSYPGDIFYAHSKLLERAGNFKHPKVGEVAISCLPVIEIVEGDFTGYISTNVMGITDGHLFLDSNIYYQGMRPAINIPLSVTRVGRQTLDKLAREINKDLTSFLAEYNKLLTISHFGQELTDDVKKKLRLGDMVNKFFNQPYQVTIPLQTQLIIIALIMGDLIPDKETLDKVKSGLTAAAYDRGKQKILFDLTNTKNSKEFSETVLKNKDQLFALVNEMMTGQPAAREQQTPAGQSAPLEAPAGSPLGGATQAPVQAATGQPAAVTQQATQVTTQAVAEQQVAQQPAQQGGQTS